MANRKQRRLAQVQYQRTFEKRFGWIRQINLSDEYVKVRLGISQLPELKQNRLLEYVRFRYMGEPQFKEVIDKLEQMLVNTANKQVGVKSNESAN